MENTKYSVLLYVVAGVVALGGLLSGYDTGVISGALLYINDDWHLSDFMQGILVSSVLAGAAMGAITNGYFADLFGRKTMIIETAILFFVASILCAVAPNVIFLMVARFMAGLAIGIVTFVVPLYLSEISPEKIRGGLVSLFQLAITAGILFSYLINAYFANFELNWRLMLLAGVIPALILLIGMFFMPDTPRWLISKGRYDEAEAVFKKIEPEIDAKLAVKEVQNILDSESKIKNKKFRFQKWMIMPLIVGVGVMFMQQWTGINTIIYYAPTIMKMAGFSTNATAIYATMGIGIVNFVMTFVAIAFCDKVGRKPLLYAGLVGMSSCLILLSFAFQYHNLLGDFLKWLALFGCIFYIMFFAFSLGPIVLLLVSEVFPLKTRGIGMSISTMSNFIFNFTVTLSFLPFVHKIGEANTFLIYGLVGLLSLFFVYFVVPETKGITLEAIEKNWIRGVNPRKF